MRVFFNLAASLRLFFRPNAMTTKNDTDLLSRRTELKARIARARRAIAFADHGEKEMKPLNLSAEQLAVIKAGADAIRSTSKQLLRILLEELKGLTP